MSRQHTRRTVVAGLAAAGLLAGGALAPGATAKVDHVPSECATWARWMSYELALYGIFGAQADSYIAQRADNPCHSRITPRSAFHAGDPG